MKSKHLTFAERKEIENKLITEIVEEIGKDRTTISKEIKSRRISKLPNSYGRSIAPCKSTNICADVGTKACIADLCPHSEPVTCNKLLNHLMYVMVVQSINIVDF